MISAKRAIFATNKISIHGIKTTTARQPILPLIGDAFKRLIGNKA